MLCSIVIIVLYPMKRSVKWLYRSLRVKDRYISSNMSSYFDTNLDLAQHI